jgi:hypothetical protein
MFGLLVDLFKVVLDILLVIYRMIVAKDVFRSESKKPDSYLLFFLSTWIVSDAIFKGYLALIESIIDLELAGAFRIANRVLRRISSARTKLLAARCECMHEHFHS